MEGTWASVYKHWLDSLKEPAPDGVWNSISNELDIDEAWANISEELDLDDVWKNVELELPAQSASPIATSNGRTQRNYRLVAALIFLSLFMSVNDELKLDSSDGTRLANEVVMGEKSDVVAKGSNPDTSTIIQERYNSVRDVNRIPAFNLIRSASSDARTLGKDQEIFASQKIVETSRLPIWPTTRMPIETDGRDVVRNYDQTLLSLDSSDQREWDKSTAGSKRRKTSFSEGPRNARWRIGIIGSVNNTWLLNEETTNGLKRSELNSTIATYGKEFGITLENRIGQRSFLRAEYYFNTEIGQRYREYFNALYQEKNIRLQYQKAQFAYSWTVLRRPSLFSPNIVGGVYASKLKLADLTIGDEKSSVSREYTPWDFGVLLGIESEFSLNRNLVVVPGLRTSYGLQNVFEGTSQSPSYFNKTKTATIGFSIAIKYQY